MKILSEEKINKDENAVCYFCEKKILVGDKTRSSEKELTVHGKNLGHVSFHSKCASKDESNDEFSAPNGVCPVCFMALPNSGVCCEG